MQLALETPTRLLKSIQPLADFDFILTHLVLKDKAYAKYYSESTRYKILDNSTNENLQPCSLKDIKKAADIVKPNLVVAPDFLGNSKSTISALEESLTVFGWEKVLPVVQGDCEFGVLKCLKAIIDRGLNSVAVPYDICCRRTDSLETMASMRLQIVNSIIRKVPIGFHIHLLGLTTLEELGNHNTGWVKSLDTGSPIMHGLYGLQFGKDSLMNKAAPTYNRMLGRPTGIKEKSLMLYNIAYLRRVMNGR